MDPALILLLILVHVANASKIEWPRLKMVYAAGNYADVKFCISKGSDVPKSIALVSKAKHEIIVQFSIGEDQSGPCFSVPVSIPIPDHADGEFFWKVDEYRRSPSFFIRAAKPNSNPTPVTSIALKDSLHGAFDKIFRKNDYHERPGSLIAPALALPRYHVPRLSTKNRWIVDKRGLRVKLSCVNWVAHLEPLIPEGLDKHTPGELANLIKEMGFNCVRFTYSIEQIERRGEIIGPLLDKFLSSKAREQFYRKNKGLFNSQSLVFDVFHHTLQSMEAAGLMIVLDNHMTDATWCCGLNDGNRWWGQRGFNVERWIKSLETVTRLVNEGGYKNVIGMGLRNEPHALYPSSAKLLGKVKSIWKILNEWYRGVSGKMLKSTSYNPRSGKRGVSNQLVREWYANMRAGAEAVHAINPDLLIIVSGMDSGSKLEQLKDEPFVTEYMPVTISRKLVFEAHFYNLLYISPFWKLRNYDKTCRMAQNFLNGRVAFLLDPKIAPTHPVWFSEFGLDVKHYSEKKKNSDMKWLQCITDWMSEWDLDWAYWVLHDKYYFRGGKKDYIETWGLLQENLALLSKLHRVMPAHLGI